jgi:hypothetical protein
MADESKGEMQPLSSMETNLRLRDLDLETGCVLSRRFGA